MSENEAAEVGEFPPFQIWFAQKTAEMFPDMDALLEAFEKGGLPPTPAALEITEAERIHYGPDMYRMGMQLTRSRLIDLVPIQSEQDAKTREAFREVAATEDRLRAEEGVPPEDGDLTELMDTVVALANTLFPSGPKESAAE